MFGQRRIFALLGILAGLLLTQACSRQMPAEKACNFVQNQDQQRVSWGQGKTVDLYLDNSIPYDYVSSVQSAVNQWNLVGNQLEGHDFFRLRGGSPGSGSPTQDGYSKLYVLNTWEANKTNEQARTTVYWSGSRIYEADVRINDKDFDYYFSIETLRSSPLVNLESLVLHELGHVLGLAHNSEAESVMQVSLAGGTPRVDPGQTDISSLSCEY